MISLSHIPVAINCYYGDPTLQWPDTMQKLRRLSQVGHHGPVGIITKGAIGPHRAAELAALGLPGLVVMVSISELPDGFEGVGHAHRYATIQACRGAGVKAFAAVRPIVPPYNTSDEVLNRIFQNLQAVGCSTACVSGFRGNDELVAAMAPEDRGRWVLRVKQMSRWDAVLDIASKCGVQLFTRVACAVSSMTGRDGTYNPYWGSPQLVKCHQIGCPLIETCGPVTAADNGLEFLRGLGYDVSIIRRPRETCSYSTETRLNCKSCCTTCFVQPQPGVLVSNAKTLGDLAFCRFVLGGTLCVKPGMVDEGQSDVGQASIASDHVGKEIHVINTWWVWSRSLDKCFGCKYCVSSLYPKVNVGCAPEDML
jgi:hypothetical protein